MHGAHVGKTPLRHVTCSHGLNNTWRIVMKARDKTTEKSKTNRLEGEGSYSATREYNEHLARGLADKAKVRRGGAEALRAVQGREGPALRKAERDAKRG